jgi:mRNA interferase MazF
MNIEHGCLYLARMGSTKGTEVGKVRPVFVIQNDSLNENQHPSTWVLPCTSRVLPENILRAHVPRKIAGNEKDCDVMIDQSRTVDNRRFIQQLGKVPPEIISEIKEKLMYVAGINLFSV